MTSPRATKVFYDGLVGLCLLMTSTVYAGDFTVKDVQGNTHHLATYHGKWVLMNFWATWCSPCLSEIPELNHLHDTHRELVVIGVAMQSGSSAKVKDFAAAHHMTYPVVMGSRVIVEQIRAAARQTEELEVLPASYLFDPKGELAYDQAGEISAKTIEEYLSSDKPSLPR
jgi:peroxiredoxin